MTMENKREQFRKGVKDGMPICLGYLSVSFAYGMTAVLSGLPFWAAVLISLTNLTSAGQVAGTNIIVAGGSVAELAVSTLIINIRYFLMSLSLSQKVEERMSVKERLAVSFGITDEIFAVSMFQPRSLTAAYMAGLISFPVLGWVGGTFLGGAITSLMPEAVSNALGIALYGMFIAIIVPPAIEKRPVLFVVVLSAVLSIVFYVVPIFQVLSGGWGMIVIAVLVSALAAWLFPVREEGKVENS